MINKYNKAFTFVELLIAMCMVGIISVMLIPSVVHNGERELFSTQVKKVQNDVQQALLLMMTQNQNTLLGYCAGANPNGCFIGELKKNLQAKVVFDNDSTELNIQNAPGDAKAKFCARHPLYLNGSDANNAANGGNACSPFSAVNLKNGATVAAVFAPNCDMTNPDILAFNADGAYKLCGYIEADVNAEKGPNTVGKDIHYFWIIDKEGLVPFGEIDTATCADNTCENAGTVCLGCTARVLHEGKITYY